jgi:hypothetical protein
MLEAASFSLRALLVFLPRVRGGDGTEMSAASEVSTEPLEGVETTRPAGSGGSGSESRISLAATDSGGMVSRKLSSVGGFPLTACCFWV